MTDDSVLDRLFCVYMLTSSTISCPKEDDILIARGLITPECCITGKGIKFMEEELSAAAKIKLIDKYWIEPSSTIYRAVPSFRKINSAIEKLISSSSSEELPEFLAYQDAGIRKIATETYKLKKEVENVQATETN